MEVSILIVDDHPTVLESLQFVFDAAGTRKVVEAISCNEALLAVRHHDIDVVLLDVALHGEDGLQALSEIHSFNPAIPVLVHSHCENAGMLWRCFHLGAAGYLVKGTDKNELLRAVERAAAGAPVWTESQLRKIGEANLEFGRFETTPVVANAV